MRAMDDVGGALVAPSPASPSTGSGRAGSCIGSLIRRRPAAAGLRLDKGVPLQVETLMRSATSASLHRIQIHQKYPVAGAGLWTRCNFTVPIQVAVTQSEVPFTDQGSFVTIRLKHPRQCRRPFLYKQWSIAILNPCFDPEGVFSG